MFIPYLRNVMLAAAVCTASPYALATELSEGDQQFMTMAAQAGQLEIQGSALAEKLAESEHVKTFAKKMVADHMKADDELRKLAQQKQMPLAAGLELAQEEQIAALAQTEGAEFDRKYAQEIGMEAHETAVNLFQSAADNAEDDDVKSYANKTLPHLQEHRQQAAQLLIDIERTQ